MENQKETQKNPQYKYASTREKLCFGIGAIGKDAICNLVGAFLMLYFTDTLYLAPAFVGVTFVHRLQKALLCIISNVYATMNICILSLDLQLLLRWQDFYASQKSQQKLAVKRYTHLHVDFQLLDLYCSVQQDM